MTRLGDVQRSETRRETRASLLTALLWFASAVIVFAMLLRMLPNSLDGKRYVPLIVALMPWLGLLSVIYSLIYCNSFSRCRQTKTFSRVKRIVRDHPDYLALGVCRSDQ